MRTAPALVVGLIAGGALGFALAGWLGDDASRAERTELARQAAAPAAAPALPAPTWSQAERLTAPPAPIADAPAPADAPPSAAADAMVGILVHGAVLDPDNRPADLGSWNGLQADSGLGQPRSVEVGPDSTYAISGLTPGAWTLSIDAQGWRPWRRELTLSAAQPVVRLDIVLQPAVVLDIKAFTPSGEPLTKSLQALLQGGNSWNARLGAIATLQPPPAALPETSARLYERWGIGDFSDAANRLSQDDAMPADVIGRLELDEPLPAYVSLMFRHLVLQTQSVEPGSKEVVFVVPPSALEALLGGVRLRVIDEESRQPITDAYANLFDSQSSGGGLPPDATGLFQWERQRPGLLELSVTAPDHEKWDGEVSVPAGGVADLGTLELSPAMAARGVVLDESGQPHSVNLRALADETRGPGLGARRYNKSGADGRFEWKTLGQRRYRLLVSDEEWTALPVLVDLRGGDANDVRIVVVRGARVRLLTRWPTSEPHDLRVEADGGMVISSSQSWQSDWTWSKRLPPGAYVAIVSQGGRDLKRVPFEVGAADIAVELAP
jgi:hypothetical protein